MRQSLKSCIYTQPYGLCTGTAGFDREHWFSRGFGNFRNFKQLEGKICKDCNNRFGRELEDVFFHSGPEALFRKIAGGDLGRNSKAGQDIFSRGANKHPPVQVSGEDPDAKRDIRWAVGNNSVAKPLRQIVLIGSHGEVEFVRLGSEVGSFPGNILELLKTKRAEGYKVDRFFGDSQEDLRKIDRLCSNIFGKEPVVFHVGEANQVIQGHAAFTLTTTYFRAVAKIGLHAFLFFYPNLTGFEPELDAIKRFIYGCESEQINRYVYATSNTIVHTKDLSTPTHAVACDWNRHSLKTRIQCFANLENRMQLIAAAGGRPQISARQGELVWVVELGANPSRLIFEDCHGAVFTYFDEKQHDYDGEMTQLRGVRRFFPISRFLAARPK